MLCVQGFYITRIVWDSPVYPQAGDVFTLRVCWDRASHVGMGTEMEVESKMHYSSTRQETVYLKLYCVEMKFLSF